MNDKHAKIQAQLAAVRTAYIASVKDKQQAITTNWDKLKSHWDNDTYDALYIVIHGLAGSAETFGFPQITRQARHVINLFKAGKQTAQANSLVTAEIDQEINKLLMLLQQTKQA